MARVERDAEGKIISVEMDKSTKHETAWGLALNSDDDEDEEDEAENEDVEAAVGGSEKSKQQSDVMHCEWPDVTGTLSHILPLMQKRFVSARGAFQDRSAGAPLHLAC